MNQFDHIAAMASLAKLTQAVSNTVLGVFRSGETQEASVKDVGAEVQLPADRLASETANSLWKSLFPDRRLIDEEVPETHVWLSEWLHYVFGIGDWLDGSSQFQLDTMMRPGEPVSGWGNTAGFLRNGKVLAGMMAQPALGQLFYAHDQSDGCHLVAGADFAEFLRTGVLPVGRVLYRSPEQPPLDKDQPLVLSLPQSGKMKTADLEFLLRVRRKLHELKLLGNERADGCAVANIARVIGGGCATYFNSGGGMAWDLAVPCFLLQKAGGVVTDHLGQAIGWDEEKVKVVAARDPHTHTRFMQALAE